MALLWIEGFEGYGTATGVDVTTYVVRRYPNYFSTFYLAAGRTGGFCGYMGSTSANIVTPSLTTADTMIVGFAVRRPTTTSSTLSLIKLYDGTTIGMDIKWNYATGEIDVYRNTTLLGSTSGAGLVVGGWYYIEVKVKCHASAGTVEVRVGGVAKLSLSNVNTKNGTDTYHDRVYFWPNSYVYLDDIYICDNTGSLNNDFLGNRKVVGLFPSGDSGTAQWTPSAGTTHCTLVDETLDNDDADFVESATSGQVDLYDYAAISNVGAISGIQINTTCRESDANSFSLAIPVKSGSTMSTDPAQAIGTTNYVNRRRIVETDPNTGAAWTVTGLNAAQFGVQVG